MTREPDRPPAAALRENPPRLLIPMSQSADGWEMQSFPRYGFVVQVSNLHCVWAGFQPANIPQVENLCHRPSERRAKKQKRELLPWAVPGMG